MSTREEKFMPNGTPKYVRCYRQPIIGGFNYTIVFSRMGKTGSNRFSKKGKGYPYLNYRHFTPQKNGFSIYTNYTKGYPYLNYRHFTPQKIYTPNSVITTSKCSYYPIDKTSNCGYPINFSEMPKKVQEKVIETYRKLWKI